jgi:preprotein translocase subunit SecG
MAMDARDKVTPMRGMDTFLGALAIMVFAAIGAMLVHSSLHDGFGFGAGVFALTGAFMLYRIFFWHE